MLKDGDFVIYESLAIMAYLESKHPEPALFGVNRKETGIVWQRIFEVMNYARDSINNGVVRPLIRGQAEQTAGAIKTAAVEVHEALRWVEGVLSETAFLAGDKNFVLPKTLAQIPKRPRKRGSLAESVRSLYRADN